MASKPEELSQLFAKHISAGDVDGMMSLYEPGAVMPDADGNLRDGADAIRAAMTQFAATRPAMTCDVQKVVVAGDIALVHNRWSMPGASGYAIEVCRKQADGSWKYIIDDPMNQVQQG
jgi:uncharacterized protein (TIGR02246 family)